MHTHSTYIPPAVPLCPDDVHGLSRGGTHEGFESKRVDSCPDLPNDSCRSTVIPSFHPSFLSLSHYCLHITSVNQTRGFLTWRTHNLRVTVPVPGQWAPSRICSITPDSYHSATPTRGEGGGEEKNWDVLIHPLNQLRSGFFSSSAPSGGLICTAGPEREGLARLQVWDNQASGLKRIRLAFLNSHIFIRAKISNWNLIKKDEP